MQTYNFDELIIHPQVFKYQKHLEKVAKKNTGTILVWDKVDRLLKEYSSPGGKAAQAALTRRAHVRPGQANPAKNAI